MCLSTVYTLKGNEKQEVCKNVASMTVEGDKLVFSDIMKERADALHPPSLSSLS